MKKLELIKEMHLNDVRISVYYNAEKNQTQIVADDLKASTEEKRESTHSKIMTLSGSVERIEEYKDL